MADQPMHMLTTMGVLASFSVSKKISEQEVGEMMKSAQTKSKDEQEVLTMVKAKIMKEIIDATKKGTLPGILIEKADRGVLPVQFIDSLNRMVLVLSQKLKGKKIDKLSLCYFINYLVGSLGLTEEDFEEFHRRLREARNGDDDEDNSLK
jgi:hypothetical protein